MNPAALVVANKLMPWLQALAAMILLVLFCVVVVAPMAGLHPADTDMKETLKNIMFILVGFLFGSSAESLKKGDQNAALTTAVINGPSPNVLTSATPAGTPSDPVAVTEVKP